MSEQIKIFQHSKKKRHLSRMLHAVKDPKRFINSGSGHWIESYAMLRWHENELLEINFYF